MRIANHDKFFADIFKSGDAEGLSKPRMALEVFPTVLFSRNGPLASFDDSKTESATKPAAVVLFKFGHEIEGLHSHTVPSPHYKFGTEAVDQEDQKLKANGDYSRFADVRLFQVFIDKTHQRFH